MSAPVNQDVIDKIKKLLRVDEERGNSQAESEQALMAAQRLALRHGINLDEIDTTEEVESEPIVGEDFTPERHGGGECASRLPTAHKYIAWILEKYFRVSIIYITKWETFTDKGVEREGRVRRLQLFGKKTNVQIAIYVYKFLHREFGELWREHKRKFEAPMSSRNSFYYGLYCGLDEKLNATLGQVEQETAKQLEHKGTSMALVLVDEKKKVDQAVHEAHPRLKYISQEVGQTDDYSAIADGQRKGRKIEIKPAIQ